MKELHNQKNHNCRVTTDTGNEYLVYSSWLHNEQLDLWNGWHCDAGNTRLFIDKNFNVYGGECRNDHLGNALDGFTLLEHAVCQQERCSGCTDDLAVAKYKP